MRLSHYGKTSISLTAARLLAYVYTGSGKYPRSIDLHDPLSEGNVGVSPERSFLFVQLVHVDHQATVT